MSYVGIGNRQDYIADFPTQSFNGDGSTTTFTLNFEAVTGAVRVAVDNVLQPADGTSYYTNGNSITFTSAPATGTANITVTYLGTVRNVSSVSDGAITTAKLADGAVTNAKLQSGSFTNITDVGTLASGLTLSDNLLFDTASKGVYLGVTSATASNLLDDYEEGTWTPTYSTEGGGESITYDSITAGRYTKIGQVVHIFGVIKTDAWTGGSSYVYLDGLPFVNQDNNENGSPLNIARASNFAGDYPNGGELAKGLSKFFLKYRTSSNGTSENLVTTDVGGTSNDNVLYFGATYQTSS